MRKEMFCAFWENTRAKANKRDLKIANIEIFKKAIWF